MNKRIKKILIVTPVLIMATAIFESCGNVKAAHNEDDKAAFKYREVYLPEGIGENAQKLGLNTLDEDWGIWGHNISKVLPEDPSQSIYAKQNGVTLKKQFCFSSNHLYGYIEEYIDSKYDEDDTVRFSIMPNDNEIVCICEKCVAAGNTKKDASPAVTKLVRRLAERFPNHIFYTSDYKTTRGLPQDSMPKNTGVMVSAINYPATAAGTNEETRFITRLQDWGRTTPRILVWDYINNFDDYFTPYPNLSVMQHRLQAYRDNHVTAVFLNGSGSDISTLSKLKTEVLASLTQNPDADWQELLYTKASEYYPVTGEMIADFIVKQDEAVKNSEIILPFYDGVEKAMKTYLEPNSFIEFHDNLLKRRNEVSGEEKEAVEILLGKLALTRLEINRITGDLTGNEKYLRDLHALNDKGYSSYNEAGWTIGTYLRDYHFLLDHYNEVKGKNKLKGEKLVALTPLDPDYSDLAILTDGILGMPSNYHNGNLITSPETVTRIAIPNKPEYKKLKVWLTYNPAYKVYLPESVSLSVGGKEMQSKTPAYPQEGNGHVALEFDVPGNKDGSLVINLYKKEDTRSMAIEEIEAF